MGILTNKGIESNMNRFGRHTPRLLSAIFIVFVGLLVVAPIDRASAQGVPAGCPSELGTADLIDHNFSVSFCELCSEGEVRIEIENPIGNPEDIDFSNLVITEDLQASGLTYVAGSTAFSGSNITVPANFDPAVVGPANSQLVWDLSAPGFVMNHQSGGPGSRAELALVFRVERDSSVTEEGLISADRTIAASLDLEPSCSPGNTYSTSTGDALLSFQEPEPVIEVRARNLDAAQGTYTDPVYGHEGDDLIWRVRIRNNGEADLQDFVFDEEISGTNFNINYICDLEADAVSVADGGAAGGCQLIGPTQSIANIDVATRFGVGPGPYIAAPAGGVGDYFFTGRLTESCTDETNTVSGVEWGCESQSPIGGLSATSGGATAGDTATLGTQSVAADLDIDVALTGLSLGQAMGGTGTVTITLTNNSGGTVRGEAAGMRIRNLLPTEYVVDPTFTPTVAMDPAYGTYDGMIDTVDWTNPNANTVPVLLMGDPADPLSNTELDLLLTSSTTQSTGGFPDQDHLIRQGDVVTVTIRTVLINFTYYDYEADLDVRTEISAGAAADSDPIESFAITNETEVWWQEFCTATLHNRVVTENDTADPEDIDPDVAGAELIFILTSTGDPLPLTVNLRNNGGKDADDYAAYVTFGEAMTVDTAPGACSLMAGGPPRPVWQEPVGLPATAAVYECDPGTIAPGATAALDFEVIKNTGASFDDDLTFRVDVIGEIHLSDGTPLWFPTPQVRGDGEANTVNDYTVDAVWARVIGYDLFKLQEGLCSENIVPVPSPDTEIEIGEECTFNVRSGGWFGFETPGFTYIAVQNIEVEDQLPDGQGYISSTDPLLTSTAAIAGITLNPPPAALDEGFFNWTFNTVSPGERITEKDNWFEADVTTRLLNDPADSSAPPNEHAAITSNVMSSTFDAVFFNDSTGMEELYNLGPNTIGFPREIYRRVDLTVTEPNLTVTKLVCNESRYGIGAACFPFIPLTNDGDAFDTYVFQITVENEEIDAASGIRRAPAYDVTVTSVTDPSDQLFVAPLTGDLLDNDADGGVDETGSGGEGTITDNVVENGTPAEVIASYTHSTGLERIGPGESVVLYYRVDPDDDVAPLQALVGSATATYDSLEGGSGAQSLPTGANGEAGGARQFTSAASEATIQIIPVETSPKQILRVSNSGLSVPANPQAVSIGEEVEFQLEALIPVAQLRSFVIRDELPTGMSCSEAPVVDLGAGDYAAAGFVPGGVFTPTCTDSLVEWSFGNQTVTMSNRMDRRFDFEVQFIARMDNVLTSQDTLVIANGGDATVTEVRYVDELSNPVVLEIGEASVLVQEPALDLITNFSVAETDAADIIRVTVTATNSGTATAYNPRFLDDLRLIDLAYRGDIQGANPPTADVLAIDADAPIFSWPVGLALAPTESITFSYAVEVATTVEPLQLLAHTIEADWTSLPNQNTALNTTGLIGANGSATGMRIGALPNAADPLNDYEAAITEDVPVTAIAVNKSDVNPTQAPEIGSHRNFEIEILLPEGITRDVLVSDALDSGSTGYVLAHNATYDITYEFIGLADINAVAPDESAFTAVPIDNTSGTAVWNIGTVTTLSEDDLATNAITPAIRIRYAARINNDVSTDSGSTLQNTATIFYIDGETGLQTSIADASDLVTVTESMLTVTKALRNVTTGKLPADPPAFNDTLEYVFTAVNGGNATAYDLNFADTLPAEVSFLASFTPTAFIGVTPVAGFVATPAGAPNGPLIWGRQNSDNSLDLGAGQSLTLTYHVTVSSPPPDATVLTNTVWTDWTSLDVDPGGLLERTGAGCPTTTAPNDYCFGPAVSSGTVDPAPPASPLVKANTQATAAVGEAFRYRITVPSVPYAFPAYDVRIYDDLTASAADMRFLSVTRISGSTTWTPVNTGTPTDLVLEDTTDGIDIPAGEQIVLEIEVVLEDNAANVTGLDYANSASYLYNYVDGNLTTQRVGTAGMSADMTIVGPDTVTMTKSGPVSMTIGANAGFTLDVQNTGTGPVWNLRLLDQLANGANAGTCDTTPSGFTAQVFASDGTTDVSGPLSEGSDFTVAFRGDPDCDFTIDFLTAATRVGPSERMIVTYETRLDEDSLEAETATNVAGATEWFSADGSIPATAGDRRTFTRALTDGSIATLDHEDAHSTTVALPVYLFEKTAINMTTGEDPAITATPGDVLRYSLRLVNQRNAPLSDIVITDELDGLNAPVAFEPGTLSLVSTPLGAVTTNTNASGGASASGLLDVRDMNLPNLGDELEIVFEATLAAVLSNGRVVVNQAAAATGGVSFALSDDPVLNGAADPRIDGDEDPTPITITSAPNFRVEKVSTDVTGDPTELLAGETLRYTITVKNIGTDNATDAMLRDAVPVNTAYAPGSTTLNNISIPDGAGGTSPLVSGLSIAAPEDPTAGALRADAIATTDNVATLRFDVVIDPAAADGTLISNQAFVSAIAGGVSDQPSDDPDTAVPDDPTQDVVGNAPLLFAPKSAALLLDAAPIGVVDPGDTLRYTITVYNNGAAPATQTLLRDLVPANTTYVMDSVTLNGLAIGMPDGGTSPLIAGIDVSSSELTPPLPAAGAGVISMGESAIVTFDLLVDAGTAPGTILSNQAVVESAELPNLLTDGDGNPATGPEPTLVVVGDGQQLAITKNVTVVGGGAALAGSEVEYTVRVTNISTIPATDIVLTDDLDIPIAGQLLYTMSSATLNGLPAGVTVVGSLITADYSTTYGPLAPGASTTLRFRARLSPALPIGTSVQNTGIVSWNAASQMAQASVSISVGGMPGVGAVNGTLWHDSDFDRVQSPTEAVLVDWVVQLLRDGTTIAQTTTDGSGVYQLEGITPNDLTADALALRFSAPDAGANTGALGRTESAFTDGLQEITDLIVPSGSNLQNLDLPIDPNGVLYDALARVPVGGAVLTLSRVEPTSTTPVSATCFDDPRQQNQLSGATGFYKFDLNFSEASCPQGADYLIELAYPGSEYASGASVTIPAQTDSTTAAFDVPACPGNAPDAIPGTLTRCEVQASDAPPSVGIAARAPGTDYYLRLTLDDSSAPGSSQLYNNHLALDPAAGTTVALTKTTPSVNVSRGDLIPYEITFNNLLGVPLADLALRDYFPAGFRYIEGSARVNGEESEPTIAGRTLEWTGISVPANSSHTVVLLLAVGAGVTEGEFVNRAQVLSTLTGLAFSGEATATVRVVPDPTFDCTDVLGKVFDDRNRDGIQDDGERGLPGVRLMTVQGLAVNTDPHGRFSITCAIVPNETRGSNFVLKLDDRTLPSGYRMSTRQTQVKRATRGKALRFRFGASVHRIVGLDLADAVFEPGEAEMRTHWKSRLGLLLDELEKSDATLRLSYIADIEDRGLVKQRLEAVERAIRAEWKARGHGHLDDLEVETETYWRRGEPTSAPKTLRETSSVGQALPHVGAGPPGLLPASGQSGERHLPAEEGTTEWSVDPELLAIDRTDRLEEREVAGISTETIKVANLVPAIRFQSGVARISDSYVRQLREVLARMDHLKNVRLHLVGHSDDQALSSTLESRFGDNEGLSRERAGEVAEFLQKALRLPPEAISFAWVGDASPVASNNTAAGRAQNRRVEVEVWYDQIAATTRTEEVVIAQNIKRLKVCRTETVCKLRYREGNERRARVKNLIAPLNYGEEIGELPDDFVQQIQAALTNLQNKENVSIKFIAHTDDRPLTGRAERIYGSSLAISKARARRVALDIKERLVLPTAGVASEGRGDSRPIASNSTSRGRALNRRIEVEFWHDDPLLELSDDFQVCPDPADAETVTRVYDPPGGAFPLLPIVDGEPQIPSDLAGQLREAMDAISHEEGVRLRFVGYTANEGLPRRTAEIYGDDIGLSTARARRTMEQIQAQLLLDEAEVEHEGRGYVHSDDVVNGGFVQGETSHVEVEVIFDELAVMDDYDGIEITPITRELRPKDPLSLNLMRITVNGEPIDDPGRSSADIQRCTDVALEETEIDFRFDDLESQRRLSASVAPPSLGSYSGSSSGSGSGSSTEPVRFRMYNNYPHFITRAEIRIFEADASVRSEPLAIVPTDGRGDAQWIPATQDPRTPYTSLRFVLRAYGEGELFDETAPQLIWVKPSTIARALPEKATGDEAYDATRDAEGMEFDPASANAAETGDTADAGAGANAAIAGAAGAAADPRLLEGYGESEAAKRNIPIGSSGSVRISGRDVPPDHTVWLAGTEIPVNEDGEFVGEVILPAGLHTVEVAVLDEEGNGELYLRDLDLERSDWFFVALADLTLSQDLSGGRPSELNGGNSTDLDAFANGRLAFFLNGKFGEDWKLTASADTREGPVEDLFTNFLDKDPDSLFRRLDPDYHYPTFGDDSTIDELAPTLGKFFVRLNKGDDHLLWGNFLVRYNQNELALVERGLYGANARYQTDAATSFGERRFAFDGFAADPGTISSRDEFRGTGGSVYFLKRQDLLIGSERLRVEIRDKDSGLVRETVTLQPELDYDVDYLQGRILLSEPLSAIADDRLLVRNDGLAGNEAVLVVQYEYTPGFDELDTLNLGGQTHAWLTDFLKVGATANHNDQSGEESSLYGVDVTLRKSAGSWIKIQASRSDGLVSTSERSEDGGFNFANPTFGSGQTTDAFGYRADLSFELSDWLKNRSGRVHVYAQRLEAGYSGAGLNTLTETDQYGGELRMPITQSLAIVAKGDHLTQDRGLETTTAEVDLSYQVSDHWSIETGARHDRREDDSISSAATQEEGERTDAVVQIEFDPKTDWKAYAFGQGTVQSTGEREENHRGGLGGAVRLTERLAVDGEVSHGDIGPAAQLGTDYQYSERTRLYLNYALDNERGYDGLHERRGSLTAGTRSRLSDSASVYVENQYQHATVTGLTRSIGIDYTPAEKWNIDVSWEDGTTRDRQSQAETERRAGGFTVGYRTDDFQVSSGFEYIFNETEQSDGSTSHRTTWLLRNNLKYQINEDGRLLAKFNHAISDSSQGDVFDGGFTEVVAGFAYRPVAHDRFNALAKYTYFYNVPSSDQVGQNGTSAQFLQKSHIAALDLSYDVTDRWTLGTKYAYRLSQVSLDRDDPDFFENDAHLFILRSDYRFLRNWESSVEGRILELPDLDERRAGALVTVYRYFGDHFKVGLGYNFTDFSEDLTDLSYDHHGIFLNVVGTF